MIPLGEDRAAMTPVSQDEVATSAAYREDDLGDPRLWSMPTATPDSPSGRTWAVQVAHVGRVGV